MAARIGKDLTGKVAVITGASSGIGAASARLFAEAGARVVVGYNQGADRANAVVESLAGGGHKAIRLRETSASFHSNLGTALFAEKEYEAAMSEYARALQLDPDIFERRSRGGVSLHMVNPDEIGRYDYVIAKMYATAGNPDRCLLYLRKALEEGYSGIKDVYKEREFERIRKDPRFVALMNSKMPQINTEQ